MKFRQGDIVRLDFDPTKGHEQAGFRPAVVVSNDMYNEFTKQIAVCPITSRVKSMRMRVSLDERSQTRGVVICDQVRVIDYLAGEPKFVETIPADILEVVKQMVTAIFE